MEIRDFSAIKAEYIAGNVSYRALAAKYNIPLTTLSEAAKREGWVSLRAQARDKAVVKYVDAAAADHAERAVRINAVADKLLDLIDDALNGLSSDVHPQALKWYTGALKDLKDIKDVRSLLDIREQEARIEKLRRECVRDEDGKEIIVTIRGGTEDMAE